MDTNLEIRDVANYIRKSRGEEDKDLEKHRIILKDLATKNNWRYIEYVEIASSENIEYRPKFKQLLEDIENDMFDAVCVVDYDRLGRGDLEDQGLVKRVFRDSQTLIITPEKIYNLTDDTDDLMVDVKGLLARQEYKSIKKRLLRGKKIGSRQGNWTNGVPPYPYIYNRDSKSLIVDEDKKNIYLEIKNMFLDGSTCMQLAHHLNSKVILSPRNSLWHENTIRRLLLDETHMGRIISNKSEGSGHKNKKTKPLKYFPREKWVIVENCHEILKTQEEHDKILTLLAKRKIIPVAARRGKYILSGLVYCGKCKYSMQFVTKETNNVSVKTCQKYDPYGNRCKNRGLITSEIFEVVEKELDLYEEQLLQYNSNTDKDKEEKIKQEIKFKEQAIIKTKKALDRVKDMYELGDYNRNEYIERKDKRQNELIQFEKELEVLKSNLSYNQQTTNKEKLDNIKNFRDILKSNVNSDIKNNHAKTIIDRIEYTRDDDDNIDIKITFL